MHWEKHFYHILSYWRLGHLEVPKSWCHGGERVKRIYWNALCFQACKKSGCDFCRHKWWTCTCKTSRNLVRINDLGNCWLGSQGEFSAALPSMHAYHIPVFLPAPVQKRTFINNLTHPTLSPHLRHIIALKMGHTDVINQFTIYSHQYYKGHLKYIHIVTVTVWFNTWIGQFSLCNFKCFLMAVCGDLV